MEEPYPHLTRANQFWLKAYLETKGVAKPYWPERLAVVEDMPRTPSGKIQKFLLRQRAKSASAIE